MKQDSDREFLAEGILPKDATLTPNNNNYNSVCCPDAREKVESTLNDEIAAGNYIIVPQKPTIICTLGAVPKADSDDLRLIHDCSMPPGKGVNSYIDIEKQHFETVDDSIHLLDKGFYKAKK